jgi:hypothetical protein
MAKLFGLKKRFWAWWRMNISRQIVTKVKDLPNPEAKVQYWLRQRVGGVIDCIVLAGEGTARRHVEMGLPLELDPQDPAGDMIVLVDEDADPTVATIAVSVLAKKVPGYKAALKTPQEYVRILGQVGANLKEQVRILQEVQRLLTQR